MNFQPVLFFQAQISTADKKITRGKVYAGIYVKWKDRDRIFIRHDLGTFDTFNVIAFYRVKPGRTEELRAAKECMRA